MTYALTAHGRAVLTGLGLDLTAVERRRPAVRYCMDWTEQRHHLAGPLGSALATRLFELDWLRRTRRRRVVAVTDRGRQGLREHFGMVSTTRH